MAKKPPADIANWKLVASMAQIQKEHPDWSDEQCHEEMKRLARAEMEKTVPKPRKKKTDPVPPQEAKAEPKAKPPRKPSKIKKTKKPGKTARGLKDRVELFCQEYCKNFGNAAAAFRSAGYAPEGAHKNAHRLMSDPRVLNRIQEIKDEAKSSLKSELAHRLDNDNILSELGHMAFARITDFMHEDEDGVVEFDVNETFKVAPQKLAGLAGYEIIEMPPVVDVQGGIVQSRQVLKHKVKLDKLKALELLMKHKNLFSEQRTLNIDDLDRLIETQSESLAQRELALQARRGLAGSAPAKPEVIDVDHVDLTENTSGERSE